MTLQVERGFTLYMLQNIIYCTRRSPDVCGSLFSRLVFCWFKYVMVKNLITIILLDEFTMAILIDLIVLIDDANNR